jgi:hypothetical protein
MINMYKLFERFSWNLALSFVFIEDAFKLRKIIPYYLSINFMMKGQEFANYMSKSITLKTHFLYNTCSYFQNKILTFLGIR